MILFFTWVFILSMLTFMASFIMLLVTFIMKKPLKRAIVTMGIGGAVAVVAFGLGTVAQEHANKVEADRVAKQEAQAVKATEQKNEKFNAAASTLFVSTYSTAKATEALGQKIQSAWHDAIFKDAGATVAGKQYTDFSEAVDAVIKNDQINVAKINAGKGNVEDALQIMRDNVTNDTDDDLKKGVALAEKTTKFAEMALSPSGNYQTFGTEFSKLDTEVAAAIKAKFLR